jgi:crotonobetainyl-CoA:carnitine CoA-transferase CaiB-like acyl-CoA transferase
VVKFLAGADSPRRGHAPALGEHTRAVLREVLGLSSRKIDVLAADGVVGEAGAEPTGTAPSKMASVP